jgi:hypothetical protein
MRGLQNSEEGWPKMAIFARDCVTIRGSYVNSIEGTLMQPVSGCRNLWDWLLLNEQRTQRRRALPQTARSGRTIIPA